MGNKRLRRSLLVGPERLSGSSRVRDAARSRNQEPGVRVWPFDVLAGERRLAWRESVLDLDAETLLPLQLP